MSDVVPVGEEEGVKVFFNPFAFTVEQNNEFIRLGYEVMPIAVPSDRTEGQAT